MKWGVRHDERVKAARKRKAKRYGISEKEVDEAKDAAKKKSGPIKGITTVLGGLMGAGIGEGLRNKTALEAKRLAYQAALRDDSVNGTIRIDPLVVRDAMGNIVSETPGVVRTTSSTGHVFTHGPSFMGETAYNNAYHAIENAIKVPIGAAAGSAIGFAGGRLIEAAIANNMMSEVGLRRDNRTYNNLREHDVRLKRD